jgi:Tol biopolymer transport system component
MLRTIAVFIIVLVAFFSEFLMAQSNLAKLPKDRAGEIGAPLGKIAFIRNGDLWVMNWDGGSQFKVVTAQNADGGMSWAPDGKRIVFPRKGKVELRSPDNLGGQHKVYDIFIGYLDTALIAKKTNWWMMITDDLGGRYPQWSRDGSRIIFTQDVNAKYANAIMPNYQTAWIDTSGGPIHIFRTDYKDYSDSALINVLMPTLGPDNQYAFVMYQGFTKLGVGISSLDNKKLAKEDIGNSIKFLPNATAPAWSPDGQWIAYIEDDMAKQGIYITSPDLKEKFLVYKPAPGQSLQTYPLSWSPDARWITFATSDGSIWIIDITGNGLKQLTGAGLNIAPAWSKTK